MVRRLQLMVRRLQLNLNYSPGTFTSTTCCGKRRYCYLKKKNKNKIQINITAMNKHSKFNIFYIYSLHADKNLIKYISFKTDHQRKLTLPMPWQVGQLFVLASNGWPRPSAWWDELNKKKKIPNSRMPIAIVQHCYIWKKGCLQHLQ